MSLLDLSSIEAFVLIAEMRSFTQAAEALGSTQSAISLKLKRLETQLDRVLLERTPRLVRLSSAGEQFLPLAKDLLAANERAISKPANKKRRMTLGISDHVAGPEFPTLLAMLAAHDPNLLLEVRVAPSTDVMQSYEDGELDAAIVRKEGRRSDGESLFEDKFGWFAAMNWRYDANSPLKLISVTDHCGVRATATKLLRRAGISWMDAFIGGGATTLAAAAIAGLGVAPMAQRIAPSGTREVGEELGLPRLPNGQVVLHARVTEFRTQATLRMLTAAFRAAKSS
jgi:DNA-binding transcriptional LysR family regulator